MFIQAPYNYHFKISMVVCLVAMLCVNEVLICHGNFDKTEMAEHKDSKDSESNEKESTKEVKDEKQIERALSFFLVQGNSIQLSRSFFQYRDSVCYLEVNTPPPELIS